MEYREQYELGIAEFNEGKFFECHDTFEEIWMDERGERKRFLQGLIQGAVGIFHATRCNFTGAYSQLTKSLDKLTGFPAQYLGIDVDALRQGLEKVRAQIRDSVARGEPVFDTEVIPKIIYDPTSITDQNQHD